MKIRKQTASILAALFLSSACLADDLYVKNKLFKGKTEGAGQGLRVEAKAMLERLGFSEYSISDGVLVIGETRLRIQESLVPLKQLAEAVGAKVVFNPALNTVDVYQNTEKGASEPTPTARKKNNPSREYYAGGWQDDWDKAARIAKRTGRPMMVYFSGSDW